MTEHIIQFGVGIDDDAIIKSVEEHGRHAIERDIELAILKKIFETRYSGRYDVMIDSYTDMPKVSDTAVFSGFVGDIVQETMEKYKDDIIRTAAEMLTEKYTRTKAWREAAGNVLKKVNE